MAENRVNKLEHQDWQQIFMTMVLKGVNQILTKLEEYQMLKPEPVDCTIHAGIDAFTSDIEGERDILITSPPYLQAQ